MTPAEIDALLARLERARTATSEVAAGRPMRMRVPADPDDDDLLIVDALRDAAALIRDLVSQRDEYSEALDSWQSSAVKLLAERDDARSKLRRIIAAIDASPENCPVCDSGMVDHGPGCLCEAERDEARAAQRGETP